MEEENVLTGVISGNSIAWEFMNDDICLTCEEIDEEIENDESLDDDEKSEERMMVECDSSHTKIIGDWILDTKTNQYEPDKNGDFSSILTSDTFNCVQVVWSKYIREVRSMCSPCFPNQADLDSGSGNIKCYDLPDYLVLH